MLVALQEGSKVIRRQFSWRWKTVRVDGGSIGRAAVVDYITANGAVEANYSAAGKAVRCWFSCRQSSKSQRLATGGSSKILISCGQGSNG